MIVGLVGFLGSGKGTVGDILEQKGFIKDSFAKPLKDACAVMFGWPRELLEGDTEMSRKWREEPDSYWSEKFGREFTPREALQKMGTEAGRDVFHKDIWVISLLNRAKGKDVVVTDVRFENEINYIHDNGGIVIRVKRGSDPLWFDTLLKCKSYNDKKKFMLHERVHESEWNWVGANFNYTIENNGTIQDLGKEVEKVLQFIK